MSSKKDIALSIYNSKLFSGLFGLQDLKRRIAILRFRLVRKLGKKNNDLTIALPEVKVFENEIDTYIVIPTFGKSDHLIKCLESIKNSVGIKPHVIIVDNGIPEQIAKVVKADEIVDQYIKNEENVGFGEACNQGLREIEGDFAFILNSDVLVFSDSLRKLIDTLEENPRAGICSSVLVNPTGRYEEIGRVLSSKGDAIPICGTRKFDPVKHKGAMSVPHVSYACVALRKQAFDLTGGFDPIFWPAYSEDVDISIQMFQKRFAVLVDLNSIVIHLQGSSSSQLADLEEIKAKNTKELLKKHDSYFKNIEETEDYLRYEYKLNRAWSANRNSYLVVTNNPDFHESRLAQLLKIKPEEIILQFIACICVDPNTQIPIEFHDDSMNFFQDQSITFFSPSKGNLKNWIRPFICCFNEIVCDVQSEKILETDEFKLLKLTQPISKIRTDSPMEM